MGPTGSSLSQARFSGARLLRVQLHGLGRDRVEGLNFLGVQHGTVMVPTHGETAIGTDAPDHRIGVGAVADSVAQVDELVPAFGRFKARIERFQIGVDIAEYQQSHFSLAALKSPLLAAGSVYRLPLAESHIVQLSRCVSNRA